MTDTPTNPFRDAPVPRRFWWLKRIAIATAVALIAAVVTNWWWIIAADKRYRAVIDSARARGEPILPEDFDAAPVPDDQNKALFLRSAVKAVKLTPEFTQFDQAYDPDVPLPEDQLAPLKTFITANTQALDLARKGRSAPGVDWQTPMRTPVLTSVTPFQNLNPQRELAKLLRYSALYHHATGNDREAIESVLDLLDQTDAVARGPSTLVVNLVCISFTAFAVEAVEKIAPDLKIDPPSAPPGSQTGPRPASREQLTRLIALLTDEPRWQRQLIRGWQGERMSELDAYNMFTSVGAAGLLNRGNGTTSVLFRAGLELDILHAIKHPTAGIAATTQPDWPAAIAKMPKEDDHPSEIEHASTVLSRIITPATSRTLEQQFRAMLERRVAAIRLAIRLYRLDHDGKYPQSLAALVPTYLPAKPVDPYAPDGRPLTYRPDRKLPVVYSVGINGKDDGGTSLPYRRPDGTVVPRWECPDIVYPLEVFYLPAPAPAATQPSTEAEDHQ